MVFRGIVLAGYRSPWKVVGTLLFEEKCWMLRRGTEVGEAGAFGKRSFPPASDKTGCFGWVQITMEGCRNSAF